VKLKGSEIESIIPRRSAEDAYRELKRHPMSTANPDELARDGTLRPQAISSDGQKIQDTIVATTKGFEPIDCA